MSQPELQYQVDNIPHPPEIWTLTLNRYQRDNLLALLNAVGYPYGNPLADPAMTHWNTGDWLGEITLMLGKKGHWGSPPTYTIDEHDHPNPTAFRAQSQPVGEKDSE